MWDVSSQLKSVLWHCPALGRTLAGFALENNCPSVAESLSSLRLAGTSLAVPEEPCCPWRGPGGPLTQLLERLHLRPERVLLMGRLQGNGPWTPRSGEEVKLNEQLNNLRSR